MEIIEYNEKYREKTINLIIEVAIEEFGFESWKEEILEFKNAKFKDNNGNCWIVVDDNENVVGTISLMNIDNISSQVKNMYVHKNHRGSGISQKLLDTLIEFSKEKEYKRLELGTYDKFERAIRFYEKNGFLRERSREDNAHIYSKTLDKF